jgi:2-methylcitrate dehydratase PrpD
MGINTFIHDTRWNRLPQSVQRQTTRCLLDTLGAAIAGRSTELSRIIHDFAAAHFAGRDALLWQDGRRVSAPGAALANGMTIDALDIHDGHSLAKGHAGAAVVPAALAATGLGTGTVSGQELLTSLAVGYEVALRAGMCLHATAPAYHSSGAWNALGCAAVTAWRLRLTPEQTLAALGIAEYHGPRSPMMRCIDHPTMLKDGSGWGAMSGGSAALLASAGFTGRPADTIETEAARPFWENLGEDWHFTRQYFKLYPVCRWAQPAVAGALRLQRQHAIEPDEITAVRIATFHEAARLAVRSPRTTEEAQYSLTFPVAAALACGTLGLREIMGPSLDDPDIQRLAERITLEEDAELSAHFPARRFAHVQIETHNRGRFEARFVEPPWEEADLPSDEQLQGKFRWLTLSLPTEAARRLEQLILTCAEMPDVAALVEQLAQGFGQKS